MFLILVVFPAYCMAQIPADSAKNYFNQNVEVCGKVIGISASAQMNNNKGAMYVVLDFGNRIGNKKNVVFSAQFPAQQNFASADADKKYWEDQENKYVDSTVCAKGLITLWGTQYGSGKIPMMKLESQDNLRYK